MFRVKTFLLLGVLLIMLPQRNIIGQNVEERLCICFDEDSENINLSFNQDSSFIAFNIIIEGFETEERRENARRKAKEEHKSSMLLTYTEPVFVKVYLSDEAKSITGNREEVILACKSEVSLDEFRKENFKPTQGNSGSRVYFITEMKDNLFKMWGAIVDPNE